MKFWTLLVVFVSLWVCGKGWTLTKTNRGKIYWKKSRDMITKISKVPVDKSRKQLHLEVNQKLPTKIKTLKMASGPKKSVKQNFTGKTTLKHKIFLKGERKSTIDIHDDNLARTPVVYSLPNGKDYYVYLKVKPTQQETQAQTFQQTSTAVQGASNLPSKTFLVTVYGEQLEGAGQKLRQALSKPVESTTRPCDCPCCSCACSSSRPLNEFECSCEKPVKCSCQSEQAEHNSPQGHQTLMIFPKAGHPLGNSGCICPCCLCSCSQSGHENYDCGCQKSPPVPCPCSATSNSETRFQPTALTYSGSNCQCQASSPTSCSCPTNSLPNNAIPSGNQVAPWTGGSSSDQTCSCPCCPCACSQFASYPSYQCGCASQSATPCPCANDASSFSQFPSDNNVVRSSASYVYPTSYPSAPSNRAVSQTFQEGGYEIEDTCDCFCCPCSCPETVPFENNQCTCGSERHVSCTCKRTNVH